MSSLHSLTITQICDQVYNGLQEWDNGKCRNINFSDSPYAEFHKTIRNAICQLKEMDVYQEKMVHLRRMMAGHNQYVLFYSDTLYLPFMVGQQLLCHLG